MKKYLIFIPLLLAILAGCEGEPQSSSSVEPDAHDLGLTTIPSQGSDGFLVSLYANVDFRVSMPANPWLKYVGEELTSRSAKLWTLIFEALPNDNTTARSVPVTIKEKGTLKVLATLEMEQAAGEAPYFILSKESLDYDSAGGTQSVTLRTNIYYETSIADSWLTLDPSSTSSELKFVAEENTEEDSRSTTVTFIRKSVGTEHGTITVTQKGVAVNDAELSRVWGKYRGKDDAWYTELGIAGANADRNIAMDGNYIYIPKVVGGANGGIAVIDHSGNYVRSLGTSDGIVTDNSTWVVSDVKVLPNGASGVLVACNMSRTEVGYKLRIYAWESLTSTPQKVEYDFTPAATDKKDARYGDKMAVSGTWQDGEIRFMQYFPGNGTQKMLIFKVLGGKISSSPVSTVLTPNPNSLNSLAELNPLAGDSYIYCGGYTGDNQVEFFSSVYTREGDDFARDFNLSPSKGFDRIMHGAQLIYTGGRYCLVWETFDDHSDDRTAFVKILQLEGDDPAGAIKALDSNSLSAAKVYPLADAEDLEVKAQPKSNGNRSGGLSVWNKDGKYYVAALGTGSGVSLFEVK